MAASKSHPHAGQDAVVRFLTDPETHGLGAGDVKRIDTHGAVVFLAGGRVYKIKRAVKYPYLDFSTLEKREAALRAEIEANRRFAPELYLDVIAVTRGENGKLALGGAGKAVEWALVMRRFDENATLDHVAERGELDDNLARALGEAVAEAHKRSPRFDGDQWIGALGRFVSDEDAAIHAASDLIAIADADALGNRLRSELARIGPLLRKRGEEGHIRRGHGDLHLRNVARIDGKPVLFDALEFDPVVAAGDVLYDLAFLLMDLLARDLRRAASLVFNRYLIAASCDEHLDALAAMPFFLALRAAIRARVALDKRELVQGKDRAEAESEARRYVALAARLIAPARPKLIAIGGLSGTGKSTIAAALAPFVDPAPGAVHMRSDIERKRLAGVGELDRLPPESYTTQSSARVYARLNELARRTAIAGHSAVIDAVHARAGERDEIASVAREAGVPFEGIWLELPLEARIRRVGARRGDASDADAEVARAQQDYDPGEIRWHRIDASGDPGEVVARARSALGL
jgi:aminoglycoside phosphotransferase family enzyme/predicted kinase